MAWLIPTTRKFTLELNEGCYENCSFVKLMGDVLVFDHDVTSGRLRRQVEVSQISSVSYAPPLEEKEPNGSYKRVETCTGEDNNEDDD